MQRRTGSGSIRLKTPKEAFTKCPHCRSPRISELINDEVYCEDCYWDSCEIHGKLLAEQGLTQRRPRTTYCGPGSKPSALPMIDEMIGRDFKQTGTYG